MPKHLGRAFRSGVRASYPKATVTTLESGLSTFELTSASVAGVRVERIVSVDFHLQSLGDP